MKNLSLPIAIIALLGAAFSLMRGINSNELVYVDVNKLLEGYERTAMERAAFNEKATTLRANVDSLLAQWQQELKDYERERANMTKKELELKQELLGNKQQQISNYQQAIQQQIEEEDQKVTQTVINDINDHVKEYGERHGHRIIFGASGNGSIMYAEDGADLTEKVLEGLNAQYSE